MSTKDESPTANTYAHPGAVRGDVVKVSSYLVMLLAQILEGMDCLLETVVAGGEGQVKDIRNEIGRWGIWIWSILPE
jgi:hypothetical protein